MITLMIMKSQRFGMDVAIDPPSEIESKRCLFQYLEFNELNLSDLGGLPRQSQLVSVIDPLKGFLFEKNLNQREI